MRSIAREAGLRPVLTRMPFALWYALARLAEILPQPPLTRNQVDLMQVDTAASDLPPLPADPLVKPASTEAPAKRRLFGPTR